MTTTFHHFPRLPPELRLTIWQHTLPENDNPAIYTWKPGCWAPRSLSSVEKQTNEHGPKARKMAFEHDSLTPVQVQIPLAQVCREAHEIGLSWARNRGIERYVIEGTRQVHARQFDPARDILYVPLDLVDDFGGELEYRSAAPDTAGRVVGVEAGVTRVALPARILESEQAYVPPGASWILLPTTGLGAFPRLEELVFVVGELPCYLNDSVYSAEDDALVQPRWEIGECGSWNNKERRFDVVDGQELYQRIEAGCAWACKNLSRGRETGFQARPGIAVRAGYACG